MFFGYGESRELTNPGSPAKMAVRVYVCGVCWEIKDVWMDLYYKCNRRSRSCV